MVSDTSTCYRHPSQRAGVLCQRCERPICPDCMHQASVGFHCPECTRQGRQEVRTLRTLHGPPRVTQGLIAANVAVFLYSLTVGSTLSGAGGRFLADWAAFGPAIANEAVPPDVARVLGTGEWWRLISSGFAHDGLLHLGLNMWALWVLGSAVERSLGPVRYATLYVACLFGGSFLAMVEAPLVFTLGASGAIYGLFGAVVIAQRQAGLNPWRTGIGTVLIINLVITLTLPNIALGGHVGGLLTGLLGGWILYEGPRHTRNRYLPTIVVGVLAVALFFGSIWAAGTWVDPLVGDGGGLK